MKGFAAKNVYPSERGLHIEHYTEAEAQEAYADFLRKGSNVELDGLTMVWMPRKKKNAPESPGA